MGQQWSLLPLFRVPVRRGRLGRLRNHRMCDHAPTIVACHHRRGGDRPIHGPLFKMSSGRGASFSSGGRRVQPTPQRVDDVVAVAATVVPHRRWGGTMAGDDGWWPSLLDSLLLQGGTIASRGKTKKKMTTMCEECATCRPTAIIATMMMTMAMTRAVVSSPSATQQSNQKSRRDGDGDGDGDGGNDDNNGSSNDNDDDGIVVIDNTTIKSKE